MKKFLLLLALLILSASAMSKKQPHGRGEENDSEFERSQPYAKRVKCLVPQAGEVMQHPSNTKKSRSIEDIDSGNEADIEFERSQPHAKRVKHAHDRAIQSSARPKKMRREEIDAELEQLQPRLKQIRLSPASATALDMLNQRLFDAVKTHNVRAAEEALKQGANANQVGPTGRSLLYSTTMQNHGDYTMVRLLLQYGADPDIRYGAIGTASYGSTSAMHHEVVRTIPYWSTLLHMAAWLNKPMLAALLIEYGANPHIEDISNRTPLDIARQQYGESSAMYTMIKNATAEYDRKRFKSRVEGIPTQDNDNELKSLQEQTKRMRLEEK